MVLPAQIQKPLAQIKKLLSLEDNTLQAIEQIDPKLLSIMQTDMQFRLYSLYIYCLSFTFSKYQTAQRQYMVDFLLSYVMMKKQFPAIMVSGLD
jgi:hypothetical protein